MKAGKDYKSFDEILVQDPRTANLGKMVALFSSLENWHAYIDRIQLIDAVHKSVRRNFDRAKNLSLYAWYVYDFHQVAEFDAISTLEMALKKTLKEHNIEPRRGLNLIVDQVWQQGWISEADKIRVKALADWRNQLAHGTTALHEESANTLELCAEQINRIAQTAKSQANG